MTARPPRPTAMTPRDFKRYEVRRGNRWVGWSNTKASALWHAKRVPPVVGYPVSVVFTPTGETIWTAPELEGAT